MLFGSVRKCSAGRSLEVVDQDRAKGTASRGKEKEKGGRKGGKEREGKEKIIISITFHEHSERI